MRHVMNSQGEIVVTGGARGKWRRAIGWIAAYALALQTLVGSFGLIQTAASAAAFDPLAIICLNSNHGGAGDQTAGTAATPAAIAAVFLAARRSLSRRTPPPSFSSLPMPRK